MNKKQYTLEEFEWVWKDSSVYDILNQFYYEHIELQKLLQQTDQLTNNWNELEEWLKEDNPNVYCCSKSSQKAFEGAKAMYKIIILNKMKEIKEKSNER